MKIETEHEVDDDVVVIQNNNTVDGTVRAITIKISSNSPEPSITYSISSPSTGNINCNSHQVFANRQTLASAIVDGKLDI